MHTSRENRGFRQANSARMDLSTADIRSTVDIQSLADEILFTAYRDGYKQAREDRSRRVHGVLWLLVGLVIAAWGVGYFTGLAEGRRLAVKEASHE